jgi:hypothetical protein
LASACLWAWPIGVGFDFMGRCRFCLHYFTPSQSNSTSEAISSTICADLIGIWALLVSALLYGIYYTTAHTVWIAGPRGRLIGATTFAILGLIFAGWYSLSGSFLAAWLAHFGAVIRLGTRHRSPPTQEVPL